MLAARMSGATGLCEFQRIDELPRNHLGKVLNTDLRNAYGQPTEGTIV